MSVIDIIMTALLAIGSALAIFLDVKLFLLVRKTKERAVTAELYELLWVLFLVIGVTASFIGGNFHVLLLVMFYLTALSFLPLSLTVFTPEGPLKVGLKSSGIDPAEKYSYEYEQGKVIKETLLVYREGMERPSRLIFGIKNPKLITMLNDNYAKHGYENPMLKE